MAHVLENTIFSDKCHYKVSAGVSFQVSRGPERTPYLVVYLILNVFREVAEHERVGVLGGVELGHVERREQFLRLLLRQRIILGQVLCGYLRQDIEIKQVAIRRDT